MIEHKSNKKWMRKNKRMDGWKFLSYMQNDIQMNMH